MKQLIEIQDKLKELRMHYGSAVVVDDIEALIESAIAEAESEKGTDGIGYAVVEAHTINPSAVIHRIFYSESTAEKEADRCNKAYAHMPNFKAVVSTVYTHPAPQSQLTEKDVIAVAKELGYKIQSNVQIQEFMDFYRAIESKLRGES